MTISVILRDARSIGGTVHAGGSTVAVDDALAVALVGAGLADYEDGAPTRSLWVNIPSIFRLRLTGTGTCTVDSRDRLGNETLAVATYTVSGATNQIEFPYAGDAAVEIRFRLTGTCKAEVI